MQNSFAEMRKDVRCPFLTTVGYVCDGEGDRNVFSGVSVNMSQSGICLYLFESPCLREGQNISFASDILVKSRKGTIRWINKVENGFYKVGLQFV
ncbi:MAG: PilZ domain-containing protein [Nitrospirae bacterium]|nr:MAG: PilZ domain-containing protein [Nitrospirota bacterium]